MNKSRKAKTKKKKVGRPKEPIKEKIEKTHFDFVKIKKLAECGLIDENFANVFGIEKRTWNNWKKQDQEFNSLLKNGKELSDKNVEQSLYKRAMGYQYQEVTQEPDKDGQLRISKRVIKEVSPDVGAIAFWLKNRQPDRWKDRTNNTTELPNEEIEALRKLAQRIMAENI